MPTTSACASDAGGGKVAGTRSCSRHHEIRELCATHGCDATWDDDDVVVVLAAFHDVDDAACRWHRCAHRDDPSTALLERAADRGRVGPVVTSPHAHRQPHWS